MKTLLLISTVLLLSQCASHPADKTAAVASPTSTPAALPVEGRWRSEETTKVGEMSVTAEWVIQPKELTITALCEMSGGRPFSASSYSPIELTQTEVHVLQAKSIEVTESTPLDTGKKPTKPKKGEPKMTMDFRRVCRASVDKGEFLYKVTGDVLTLTDKEGKKSTRFLRAK